MKKEFLFFTILLFTSRLATAQAPGIEWQKSLGGTAADEAKSVAPTSDGGYIVGGTTSSNDGDVTGNHGGKDCWVVKLNAAGSIEWQKTYGGTGDETFGSIRATADGGYIMAATTSSNDGDVSGNHGGADAWAVKLTNTGAIDWQKCFGSSLDDGLDYIEETFDGGFITKGVCGTNDGDVVPQFPESVGGGWIIKLSAARTIQWQKTFSVYVVLQQYVNSIRQTSDGGYVYSYYSTGGTSDSYSVVKLDSAGIVSGSDNWNSSGSGIRMMENPRCIIPTPDGGCITVYQSSQLNMETGYSDYFIPTIKKYNSSFLAEWTKPLANCIFSSPASIINTADGGYLIIGNTAQPLAGVQGGTDYWLAKLNSTGTLQWQRALGSFGSDKAYWGECLTDSSYIVVGKAVANSGEVTGNHGGDDFWVVKVPYSSPGFAIISSAGANGTISPVGGNIYPSGINQTFRITPNTGYHIANVLVDNVSDTGAITNGYYTFPNVTASHTISVTFAINAFTINSSAGPNGSISPAGNSGVGHGSSKSYAITPSPGYSILDVLVDNIPINPVSSYTFSNITANHTIRAIFASLDSTEVFVCPAGDSATITSNITGTSYRWQLNSGAATNYGYTNLNDGQGLYFTGTSTATLTIKNYTSAAFGYKYRCVVDEASSLVNVLRFKNIWNGTFDTHWEIPQNWSCGRIPDATTDVVIPAGTTLIISTDITIRSLSLGIGANVTLAPGGNLIVLH